MDLSRSARSKEELLKVFRTEEILQAARRVISRDGLADASVERIAAEAGVAKGTLYLYFDSKETLLARACEPVVAELLRRTRRAIQRTRACAASSARPFGSASSTPTSTRTSSTRCGTTRRSGRGPRPIRCATRCART